MKVRGESKQIVSALLRFSLTLILSGILQQLYNWVDAFIVGNVEGELALAAVGATGAVINFYLMAITGFTLGLAILFARKFGAGETEDIPKILGTFSVLLGVIVMVLVAVGMVLTVPMLKLMNTTADTMSLAREYLRVVFPGLPFLAVYNVYAAALRGIGDSRTPFAATLVSSGVNMVLDILFVAVLPWGVAGAAAATVISQVAMVVFLVGYGTRKYPLLRFSLGHVWDVPMLKEGLRLGIPPMIQSGVSAFGNLILQNFMNGFGTQTVAAITTAYRVDCIVLLPVINLGSGISTLVAQSHGGGDRNRARRIFGAGTALMTVASLLLTVLVVAAGGPLIAMFGAGAEAVAIGRAFFRRLASFYLVYGLAMACRGYLEGRGDVTFSSGAGIASLAVRIGASYALAGLCGNMTIAYAEMIAWALLLVMYLLRVLVKKE